MNTESLPNLPLCRACGKPVNEQDQFCTSCGFPLKGTEVEQQIFISRRHHNQRHIQQLSKKIKNAQTTLFVLSGLFVLGGVLVYFVLKQSDLAFGALITYLILAAVFLALGGWAKKKPVVALISGLVLYVLVQLIAIIEDPENIIRGILIKIIVIVYLVTGLQSALQAEKIKKEHNIP